MWTGAVCHGTSPGALPAELAPGDKRFQQEWHERVERAKLSSKAEQAALVMALYAEALRVNTESMKIGNNVSAAETLSLFEEIVKLDPNFVQAQLKVALCLFQMNKPDLALAHLKKACAANPESFELKSALAYAYRLNKEHDNALRLAKEIIALDPQQITAYRVIFEEYADRGKVEEAMKLVQETVKQNTANANFWLNLAKLYHDLLTEEGKSSLTQIARQLQPIYAKAIECGQPSSDLLLLAADNEIQLERYDQAAQFLRQALQLSPRNVDLLLRLGNLEINKNNKTAAIKLYEKAYAIEPNFQGLGEMLAKLHMSNDQPERAVAVLEDVIRRSPTRVDLYIDLGDAYERTKQLEKAEENYLQAVHLNPRTPLAHLQLSMVQLALKKYAQATMTLKDAAAKFPQSSRVPFAQALVARQQNKYDEALVALSQVKALAIGPEAAMLNPGYYLELALTQELAGKKELVEPTLREGLKKFPNDESLLNSLAYFWANQGTNLEEALKLSKQAVAAAPGNGAFMDTLGWVYYKLEQYEQALPWLEKAAQATQNDREVLEHLAELYSKLHRINDAIAAWQKLLKDDPSNAVARAKLEAAQAQAKNTGQKK